MARIFDGKAWAASEEVIIKQRITELRENFGIVPKLVSILVGDSQASILYTKLKREAAVRVGARFDIRFFESVDGASVVTDVIHELNGDESVHGIMVQLPLPENIQARTKEVLSKIAPEKDVDGLRDDSYYLHPTSKAIHDIIEGVTSKDALVVVVGASGMVGRPLVAALESEGYKIIPCDIKTKDLQSETLKGDVIVSATGVPGLITGNMVREKAVVIDTGSPKGDVLFDEVAKKAGFITPVPGGVGPVTITALLSNLVLAAESTVTYEPTGEE